MHVISTVPWINSVEWWRNRTTISRRHTQKKNKKEIGTNKEQADYTKRTRNGHLKKKEPGAGEG